MLRSITPGFLRKLRAGCAPDFAKSALAGNPLCQTPGTLTDARSPACLQVGEYGQRDYSVIATKTPFQSAAGALAARYSKRFS